MFMRHPLTLLTKEVPTLDLTTENVCLLMQDLHSAIADTETGWLATYARSKVVTAEFREYFDMLELVAPNISALLESAREIELTVVYSCMGYRPPDSPSAFQVATGWTWNLDAAPDVFREEWEPRAGEPVLAKPGWSALANERFSTFLEDQNIQYFIVAGALYDLGIRQTCIDLADRGFGSLIVSDAVAALTDAGGTFTRGNIAHGLIKMRTMGEVLALLDELETNGFVAI